MDIRKFFGSPPSKKGSSQPVQKAKENLKEANNNSTAKRNENRQKENSKESAKNRDTSRDRKSNKKAKDGEEDRKRHSKHTKVHDNSSKSNGNKERERQSSEEIEVIESDDEKPTRSSKKRQPSTENSSTKKKKSKRVSLEDSDDDEFDEIVRKPKSKSSSRGKKGVVFDSDSEEEPIPSKSKRKSSEYQSVYIVDSDEETQKKKKPSPLKAFMTKKTPAKSTAEVKKSLEDKAKRTPVSAADFFGGGNVQRVERKPANKRKLEAEKEPPTPDDSELHDDDDFEKTLAQLDEQEHKPKKAKVEQPLTPDKSSSPSKISLSSKLSSLAKSSKVLAEDTPEGKKISDQRSSPRKAARLETATPSKSPVKGSKKTPPKQPETKTPVKIKTPSPDKTPLEKKGSNSGYRSYLHRDGPQSLGSKEFPEGKANCLEGSTFVITGVLESFERDETKTFIEKHGGKVTTSLSKKTSYIVVGRDAGESKLSKAAQFGTKQLDEDGLLALVKALPGKRSKYEIQAEEDAKKEKLKTPVAVKTKSLQKFSAEKSQSVKLEPNSPSQSFSRSQSSQEESQSSQADQSEPSLLWVDKYKPTSLKRIIGQTGDKSNANKLSQWLKSWHKNRALGKKPTGGMFGKDDGSGHRAALLSGPPGVGKTTTATLVCQEAGFSYVELNASDTRSKKTLENMVAESLNNQTLVDFMGDSNKSHTDSAGKKHCIIMDEVDGVAGNEDRGGIQELIQLIKGTRIPIICICNDRNHQKMRSLVNYCFDLRFYKPRVEQIKGAMMSIIFKEGLSIPPPALNEIILAANQDVRQVIHNLSMWCATSKSFTFEQAKSDSEKAKKDLKIGPFDVCRKVFEGGEEKRKMSIIDKSDLFFNDYSIAPLFVQENYIHVTPYAAKGSVVRHLSQLAKASDSLCTGDLIEKKIRAQSKWGLLPMEAIFASVIPGEVMQGGMSGMIAFPSWLGKNSTYNKNDRILQELHTHMSLHISSDKRGLNLDYLPFMRNSLTEPLVRRENEGVGEVIELMDSYNVIKEDFDNIMEVSKWPNSSDPFSSLSSKTKAAFTRAYNKESHMTPYSIGGGAKKKKGGGGGANEDLLPGEEEEGGTVAESDEEDDSVGGDGMIKMKKPSAASAAGSKGKGKGKAAGKPTETKGKGRGKGKGKS